MVGQKIHDFAKRLWPINRSITGEGVRQTLSLISKEIKGLNVFSVPSHTKVFDWTVPKEWKVNKAYILTPDGKKICDFHENNLHLLGYSTPFFGMLTLAELRKHLHTLPEQPQAIPYCTSYYKERWGFCLSQNSLDELKEGVYQVVVDTELFDGVLNYGEVNIKGVRSEEIFISTYICHPSMANNELSGPSVVTFLVKWLQEQPHLEYSYRIVFIPETIGSITYLSKNYRHMKARTIAGFNVSCVGDSRTYSYLPSRTGNTLSDRVAMHVLKWISPTYIKYSWLDRGSDERQYCSPGIDLPIASILRSKFGSYPEYHTSLDDLEFVTPEGLDGGYWAIRRALEAIENNQVYKSTVLCEPQMGKRGLYPTLSTKSSAESTRLIMNFLTYCDGTRTLLEIADKIDAPIWELYKLVNTLSDAELIKKCSHQHCSEALI